jgi:hypothetical protein
VSSAQVSASPVLHGELVSGPVMHGELVPGPVSPADPYQAPRHLGTGHPDTTGTGYGGTSHDRSGYGQNTGQDTAWQAAGQPYSGSGLTAADLRWNTDPPPRGRIWKLIGAVVAALALLAGAATGGYLLRGPGDRPDPRREPVARVATPKEIQKGLVGQGFECTAAFSQPVAVDLCFREDPEYRESVGFQMIDADRASWLQLRVESVKPGRNPVKDRALLLFGAVIDRAVPKPDATAARTWLADNLPEDYAKNEYLEHEAGGVGLKLLPHNKQWALLWVRLNAAAYRHVGEPVLGRATPRDMEKYYRADGFTCRPSEGGTSCEKPVDSGTLTVAYQVRGGRIGFARLTASPNGHLAQIAPTARQQSAALLGLVLAEEQVAAARTWLDRAFDGKPHHTVLSGTEVRVTPVEKAAGQPRSRYVVDVNPANW